MKSNKQRIRIDYAPLNVAASVVCLTPASPATQVFNAGVNQGEYEPDREASPSVFWPQVVAATSDGSWENQFANNALAQMKWYVNGVLISEHPDFSGHTSDNQPLYSVNETATNYRGALTIRKNVSPDKQYALRFVGVIADNRLGTNVRIETDEFILSTQDQSEDAYSIGIGEDQIIQYNPFKDRRLLYDYKVAHGLAEDTDAAKAETEDENSYIRKIPVYVQKGENTLYGFATKLFRVDSASSFTEMTAADPEVVEITPEAVTLDLRVIEKGDYMIKAVIEGSNKPAPQIQFSVGRIYQDYNILPTNGAAIMPGDVQRFDKAMVSSDGNVVECPESIIRIVWKTDTAYLAGCEHNEGDKTLFTLAKTKIGVNHDDDWMDIYTESEIKEAYKVATEGEDVLTDENGNILIFN